MSIAPADNLQPAPGEFSDFPDFPLDRGAVRKPEAASQADTERSGPTQIARNQPASNPDAPAEAMTPRTVNPTATRETGAALTESGVTTPDLGDPLANAEHTQPIVTEEWGPIEAVFLADLHLGSRLEPRHFALRDFLAQLCARPDRPDVYILGDLFNYWMGRKSEREEGNRFVCSVSRRRWSVGCACISYLAIETSSPRAVISPRSTAWSCAARRHR